MRFCFEILYWRFCKHSKDSELQDEKADKDAQIKQMKEECLHQEELINKL